MNEFIVAYICENNNDLFFRMSLDSTLGFADKWVIIDGGSTDGTIEMVNGWAKENNLVDDVTIISKSYKHDFKGADGNQRNQYLKFVADEDWILVLDTDELLSDNGILLKDYALREDFDVFDIQMVHFIYSLGLVDSTLDKHFVNRRFFKKKNGLCYDEVEHPILKTNSSIGKVDDVIIWHLGYVRHLIGILRKYDNNLQKSNIHNKDFLKMWKDTHLMGTYPVKPLSNDLFDILPWGLKNEIKK